MVLPLTTWLIARCGAQLLSSTIRQYDTTSHSPEKIQIQFQLWFTLKKDCFYSILRSKTNIGYELPVLVSFVFSKSEQCMTYINNPKQSNFAKVIGVFLSHLLCPCYLNFLSTQGQLRMAEDTILQLCYPQEGIRKAVGYEEIYSLLQLLKKRACKGL